MPHPWCQTLMSISGFTDLSSSFKVLLSDPCRPNIFVINKLEAVSLCIYGFSDFDISGTVRGFSGPVGLPGKLLRKQISDY